MIVLANGCFDVLHYGHIIHLMAAKKMGMRLVVSLTNDEQVRKEKGDGRPVFKQGQRAVMLASLRYVDRVHIVPSAIDALELVKPNIFVKGIDYVGRIGSDVAEYCDKHGIQICFTETPKFSTTSLLNELRRG